MTQEKTCNRCGASFGCGRNDAACWCTTLPPLPAAVLDALKDCYCPRCLAAIVAARNTTPVVDPQAE